MSNESTIFWRKCTTCKKSINYNSTYWVCTVSTCNSKRASMVFCSMDCWNVHLPIMNHREAYSEEKKSPVSFEAARKLEQEGKKTSATKNASAGASNPNFQSKSSIVIRRKGSPES